jgi:hypothetical protein
MANILFVTWDGGGNLPPAIGIAAELQRRGDAVRFLGHEQQRNVIEKAGLRFEPYSDQHGFSTTTPESWVRWVRSLLAFVNDRSIGSDMLASVQREPTDLVVIDCVLQSVLQAAEQSHLRRAVLVHSFYAMGAWSTGSNGPIARLRGRDSTEPWGGADVGLVATLRSLDPDGHKTLHEIVRFTGPVWQGTPRPAQQTDGEAGASEPEQRVLPRPRAGAAECPRRRKRSAGAYSRHHRSSRFRGTASRAGQCRAALLPAARRPAADRLTGHRTRRPRHHHGSTLPRSADHRAPHGQVHGSAQDRTSTREGRRRMPTPKKIITGTHSDGHRTSSWG